MVEEVEYEAVFGIAGPSRGRAGAAELSEFARAHRGIDDGRHRRRDGTATEGAGRVRKGPVAPFMAVPRDLVVDPCSFVGEPSPAATRHFARHPEASAELVSTRM
jgi:hypothetical protein